jgi:UDPglucose 6-dehydrogenase
MAKGAEVVGHDPEAMDNFKELMEVKTAPSVEETVEKADCVILMTEWKEYTKINLKMLRNRMSGNVIIDGRRAFNPEQIEAAGFDYRAIGLG